MAKNQESKTKSGQKKKRPIREVTVWTIEIPTGKQKKKQKGEK